jgi:Tfp pilus assembly protein PilN
MINLLPPYWQKKLANEEICKTAAILGIVAVAALLAFALMLLLVRVFYSAELKALDIAVAEKEQEMKIFKVEPTEKEVFEKGQLAAKVGNFYKNQARMSAIFLEVAGSLPPGVTLSDFGFSLGKVGLNGFAADRDSLVAFKNILEKHSNFKNIDFPPENWLTAKDINFSVYFDYDTEKNNQ